MVPKAPIFLCFTKLALALQITILAKTFIIVLCDMVQNVKEGQTIGFILVILINYKQVIHWPVIDCVI